MQRFRYRCKLPTQSILEGDEDSLLGEHVLGPLDGGGGVGGLALGGRKTESGKNILSLPSL